MKAQASARPRPNLRGSGGSTVRAWSAGPTVVAGGAVSMAMVPPQLRSDVSARVTRYWMNVMITSTSSSATDIAEA
nr:hypothetical protein GCM10020092_038360 [Actinoplanes digitatis]